MVESESFIKEVSEEVKRDKLFKVLKKFRWHLITLILVLVGGVGGYEYHIYSKKLRAEKNGDFLVSSLNALKNNGNNLKGQGANKLLDILIKLSEAKFFEEKGDIRIANEIYAQIIEQNKEEKFFNHYAKLQIYLLDPAEDLGDTEKIKMLDELSAPDAPLKLLALEEKLYLYIKSDDLPNIRNQIKLILSDITITPQQRNRIKEVESIYEQN